MVKKLEASLTTEFTTLPSPTLRLAYCPLSHAYSGQGRAEQIARDRHMDWKTLLASITGTVDQELLLRNEYLAHARLPAHSPVLSVERPDLSVQFLEPGDGLEALDYHVLNLLMIASLCRPDMKAHPRAIMAATGLYQPDDVAELSFGFSADWLSIPSSSTLSTSA